MKPDFFHNDIAHFSCRDDGCQQEDHPPKDRHDDDFKRIAQRRHVLVGLDDVADKLDKFGGAAAAANHAKFQQPTTGM